MAQGRDLMDGGQMAERRIDRASFPYFTAIQTRWSDNDQFGHINNVVYYRFFEVVVTDFLAAAAGVALMADAIVPFTAESLCRYRRPLSYPEPVQAGLRVGHLGKSSVRYDIGLFRAGEDMPAAEGYWVHVFVDRQTERPCGIPDPVRAAFAEFRGAC